jgi:hypothetical protein
MFRSIYIFFALTGVLCLLVKFIYHRYKRVKPFPDTSFAISGTKKFLSLFYVFLPLKSIPDDPKENRIRKALNYGLFYYYSVVIVLAIGDAHFSKMLQDETPKRQTIIVDSSTLVKPLSDSEKAAIKDSFNQQLKKPVF